MFSLIFSLNLVVRDSVEICTEMKICNQNIPSPNGGEPVKFFPFSRYLWFQSNPKLFVATKTVVKSNVEGWPWRNGTVMLVICTFFASLCISLEAKGNTDEGKFMVPVGNLFLLFKIQDKMASYKYHPILPLICWWSLCLCQEKRDSQNQRHVQSALHWCQCCCPACWRHSQENFPRGLFHLAADRRLYKLDLADNQC